MFRIVLRTPEEKADLEASWARPDEEFFASGACHILAGAFLEEQSRPDFYAVMIKPTAGARGAHVVTANRRAIFDCRGWSPLDQYLRHYSDAMSRVVPGWSCELFRIDDPIGWDFCIAYRHRHPTQFGCDPMPRAKAFLSKFSLPPYA